MAVSLVNNLFDLLVLTHLFLSRKKKHRWSTSQSRKTYSLRLLACYKSPSHSLFQTSEALSNWIFYFLKRKCCLIYVFKFGIIKSSRELITSALRRSIVRYRFFFHCKCSCHTGCYGQQKAVCVTVCQNLCEYTQALCPLPSRISNSQSIK